MNKPRSPRTHRPKTEPEPLPVEPIDASANWTLLYSGAGPPQWDGVPDPAAMYSFAIREMAILARLCPDLQVKYHAIGFLAKEFAPKAPSESEEELQRRKAHIEIAEILKAKGIAAPEDAPLEMETVEE